MFEAANSWFSREDSTDKHLAGQGSLRNEQEGARSRHNRSVRHVPTLFSYFFSIIVIICIFCTGLRWALPQYTNRNSMEKDAMKYYQLKRAKVRLPMRWEFSAYRAACYYYLNHFTIILIIYTIICIISKLETAIWVSNTEYTFIAEQKQVGTSPCNTSGINPAQSKCPVQALAQRPRAVKTLSLM